MSNGSSEGRCAGLCSLVEQSGAETDMMSGKAAVMPDGLRSLAEQRASSESDSRRRRALLGAWMLLAALFVGCAPTGGADADDQAVDAPEAGQAAEPGPADRHLPSDVDRAAILGTVQALFDALAERDGQALRDLMSPDVLMHSVERAADGVRSRGTSTLDELVSRVETSEELLTERMFDPEVRISGDLAMVWTPYDFYVGSDLSHCGADAVLLTREADDSWRIVALSWTRLQPPECELHPDGPPS